MQIDSRGLFGSLTLFVAISIASAETIPFDSERWRFSAQSHQLVSHLGRSALYLEGGEAYIDDLYITDGAIEFDIVIEPQRGFSGALWRMYDGDNFEEFYLRHHQSGNPDANQYTPIFNASAAWQLYYGEGYAAPTEYRFGDWMHVKVEFSGSRANVYIDADEPVLRITELKHPVRPGKVGVMSSFAPAYFSNFRVRRFDAGIPVEPVAKKTVSQEGVIASWLVSSPFSHDDLDDVLVLGPGFLAAKKWRTLPAEANGLTNLAQVHGRTEENDTVFARATVLSEQTQKIMLQFGYSDRARVYVNNHLVYQGSNAYRSRDYRYLGTVGLFDAVAVDLNPGNNDILFAVQEDFGGWGLMARTSPGAGVSLAIPGDDADAGIGHTPLLSRTLDARIAQRAAEGFTGSVLVSHGGETILNRTYGPDSTPLHQSEPAYWIASGSKQFTGAAIALLAGEGKLDLDASISTYLPDVPADKTDVSCRHLLTHTSGLGQRYAAEGIEDRAQARTAILDIELESTPGQDYAYSNDGFTLLAIIVEAVAGLSFEEYLRTRLIEPAGMINTGFWGFEGRTEIAEVRPTPALNSQQESIYRDGTSRANWGYRGATGLFSTTQDLDRWLQLMIDGSGTERPFSMVASPQRFIREVDGIGSVYYGFGLAVIQKDGVSTSVSHIGDEDWLGHNSALSADVNGDRIVVLSNAGYMDDGTPWSVEITRDIRRFLQNP